MLNRDLLVLSRNEDMTSEQIQFHVSQISTLLYNVENMTAFCIANEIIDINRYKIVRKPYLIEQILRDNNKPFVFVVNKN